MSGDGMHSDIVGGRDSRPSSPSANFVGLSSRLSQKSSTRVSDKDPWRSVNMSKHC